MPGLEVLHDFVSEAEADALCALADEKLAGRPYESSHYDKVITGFRECHLENEHMSGHVTNAVRRMRLKAWQATEGAPRRGNQVFPHAQFIDLLPEGRIEAHRDNVQQFGEFTGGLNLLSSAVIRFRKLDREGVAEKGLEATAGEPIDIVLRPRTYYVMHGAMRWDYTQYVSVWLIWQWY